MSEVGVAPERGEANFSAEELARMDWTRMPQGLRELRSLVGTEATVRLAGACGGSGVYVPRRPGPEHWLAQLLGEANARMLGEVYGGDKLEVPTLGALRHQERLRRMRSLREAGMSITALARTFGLTRRRVFQILAEA
jgi:hypothetical protein